MLTIADVSGADILACAAEGGQVKAIRILIVGLLAFTSSAAHSADAPLPLIIHTGGSSFTTVVPHGWVAVSKAGSGTDNLARRLFDLVPTGSGATDKIIIAYYSAAPITAQLHWGKRTPRENAELPLVEDLPGWTFFGLTSGKIRTAYYATGDGTLVVDISIGNDDEVEVVLLPFLRSFKELR